MYISNASISNFKSIKKINIPFDKIGKSYTKIFVGVNESGKSNILEALSYFEVPQEKVVFEQYCNQKMEEEDFCDLYFTLNFDKGEDAELYKIIKDSIISDIHFNFTISDISKNIFLENGCTEFGFDYSCDIICPFKDIYFKITKVSGKDKITLTDNKGKTDGMEPLTKTKFREFFKKTIDDFFLSHEPKVSIWKSAPEYLITEADLNVFKENVKSNKPLLNIFKLSGYVTSESISKEIKKLSNPRSRSHLQSKLNESLNDYINKIWSNSIDVIIELTESGKFSFLIKDKGSENKHDRFSITDRSQGAQQFLSLILSLSLETKNQERKNELILIDEPEVHLHPSGIRDIAKELLKIGENNHVFLATHSPFMIDKKGKERHFIVKKDRSAITNIKRIKETDNIIDDEVLREAFGIDVYKDLLNPHSILVEGLSDKLILQKTFQCLKREDIGLTNGHGSNLDTLASKFNHDDLSIAIILDDDADGKKYKEKILKIGGIYNETNVFTIRDLVGEIVNNGTIEDTLNVAYVKSRFIKFYKENIGDDIDFEPSPNQPILSQIKEFLKSKRKLSEWNMDGFKKYLSDEFNPTKQSLEKNNPLLFLLANKILNQIKKENIVDL